jgi:hypothetical protein
MSSSVSFNRLAFRKPVARKLEAGRCAALLVRRPSPAWLLTFVLSACGGSTGPGNGAQDDDARPRPNTTSDGGEGGRDAGEGGSSGGGDPGSPSARLIAVDEQNTSALLGLDHALRLTYVADAQGNVMPDFSSVGYEASKKPIPDVPSVVTVEPGDGDDSARIQAAIDMVAARTIGSDGFRGAVELARGTYEVGTTLSISKSGIVLRGTGADETSGTARDHDGRPAQVSTQRIPDRGGRLLIGLVLSASLDPAL